MKSLVKRLSSMFLALVMIVSVTPFSGALLADETDTETPAVTESKETEQPKETEAPATEAPAETEAPKETEAPATEVPEETEAPKETEATAPEAPAETEAPAAEKPEETEAPATEAPKETEAPVTEEPKETEAPAEVPEETEKPEAQKKKAPDASVSQNPKKGISLNASINDKGVLTWDEYPGAGDYEIEISGAYADYYYGVDDVYETFFDLKKEIDNLIRYGDIERKSPYTIILRALKYDEADMEVGGYEENEVLSEWTNEFSYESTVKPSGLGKVNTQIKNGILTWKKYSKAYSYRVILCGQYYDTDTYRKFYLNDQIDWMIASGNIEKADSYRVRVVAFNRSGKILADKAWDYEYSSAATLHTMGTVTGIDVKDGILTFDKFENAEDYMIYVDDDDTYIYSCDENSMDINDFIDSLIEDEDCKVGLKDSYKITVCALSYSPEGDECYATAEGSYDYAFQKVANPLNVNGKTATVKYKKLKKKKQTLSAYKVISGLGTARGDITFTKKSGNKNISINKSTGRVTIKKKGLKKGKTYTVTVKIKAAGNYGYDPSEEKTVTFRIKVKK